MPDPHMSLPAAAALCTLQMTCTPPESCKKLDHCMYDTVGLTGECVYTPKACGEAGTNGCVCVMGDSTPGQCYESGGICVSGE